MVIDWQASKEEWVKDVQKRLVPRLLADRRFPSSSQLVARFEASVERWRKGMTIRPLINDANELAAAAALLDKLKANDQLDYEPRLSGTPKSIDFRVVGADGARGWIDMKTVAPGWQDDRAGWERIVKIAEEFPDTAKLIVHEKWGGAAIGGQLVKARWSFVQRTVELEQKIALLTESERGLVRLLLCSEGSWREDDLEDFADFYRTGKFRPDDWAQNAIARYMAERKIEFAHTISGFCYLERRHDEVGARKLVMDVKGPLL